MTVGCCRLVNGFFELELLDDLCRPQVENLTDFFCDKAIVKLRGAVAVYKYAHRSCNTDGVGNLDENLVSYPCGHKVLCNVPRSVGRRTVNLRRILAGEGSASVSSLASVSVHDDFPSGQSRVPVRSSDDEFSGRVHVKDVVALEKGCSLRRKSLNHLRDENLLNVLSDFRLHTGIHAVLSVLFHRIFVTDSSEFLHHEIVVLGRDDNCVDSDRFVGVSVVLDSEL